MPSSTEVFDLIKRITRDGKKVAIVNSGCGLGDKIQFTMFPENFYYNFNSKVVDISKLFVFDHNPYIDREPSSQNSLAMVIDLWFNKLCFKSRNIQLKVLSNSHSFAERWCIPLGMTVYIREPRLYVFEQTVIDNNKICVHTTGKTCKTMPNHVINFISERYKNWNMVQVGGKDDIKIEHDFIKNKLGNDIWDIAEDIASASIFIGVNSGMLLIANCYPGVRKKVILTDYNEKECFHFIPMFREVDGEMPSPNAAWMDFNYEFYNIFERDIGITRTYRKI